MPFKFKEDEEDDLEPGMPGAHEEPSILDKIKSLIPEDIQEQIPDINDYKKSALEGLSGMKNSFMGGLERFENQYNAMTPEQKAEQALGMAMGSVGGIGKLGNVLKTEVPIAQSLRAKALEKLAQGSEQAGGFMGKHLPELQGVQKGTLQATHPAMQKIEQMMASPENMDMLRKLQSLKNQYGKF